jgi:hypothetical protein
MRPLTETTEDLVVLSVEKECVLSRPVSWFTVFLLKL